MTRRDIGKEIIEGLGELKAWKRGEKKLKTYTVELPTAADVPTIRQELGLSQEAFAGMMGVSVGTLRNWEQHRREPQGPARALLLVASKEPAALQAAFKAARVIKTTRVIKDAGMVAKKAEKVGKPTAARPKGALRAAKHVP